MKLTPRQIEVVRLMADGWSLGRNIDSLSNCMWMQKGGLGKGGEAHDVHSATFNGLSQKGLIVSGERHFPTTEWVLTVLGRDEAELRKEKP